MPVSEGCLSIQCCVYFPGAMKKIYLSKSLQSNALILHEGFKEQKAADLCLITLVSVV